MRIEVLPKMPKGTELSRPTKTHFGGGHGYTPGRPKPRAGITGPLKLPIAQRILILEITNPDPLFPRTCTVSGTLNEGHWFTIESADSRVTLKPSGKVILQLTALKAGNGSYARSLFSWELEVEVRERRVEGVYVHVWAVEEG